MINKTNKDSDNKPLKSFIQVPFQNKRLQTTGQEIKFHLQTHKIYLLENYQTAFENNLLLFRTQPLKSSFYIQFDKNINFLISIFKRSLKNK